MKTPDAPKETYNGYLIVALICVLVFIYGASQRQYVFCVGSWMVLATSHLTLLRQVTL